MTTLIFPSGILSLIFKLMIIVLLSFINIPGQCHIILKSTPQATIFGADTICPGDTAWITVSLTSGKAPWNFSYLHNGLPAGEFQNLSDTVHTFPVVMPGTYTLGEINDFDGAVSGTGEVSIAWHHLPEVSIQGLKDIYTMQYLLDTLFGNPEGGVFNGPGVIGDYFVPSIAGEGTHIIIYNFTTTEGCLASDSLTTSVWPAVVKIDFEGNKTVFCSNDAPFLITAGNLFFVTGVLTLSHETGLTDNGDNTATVYPALLDEGKYTITYSIPVDGVIFTCYDTLTIMSANTDFMVNNEVYQANAENADYKWINCDASTIIGNDRTFVPQATGNFALVVNQNGCIDTSGCFHAMVFPSAIDEWSANAVITYPSGNNIRIIFNKLYREAVIRLYDTSGKMILSKSTKNSTELMVEKPEIRGVYILVLTAGKDIGYYKVMIE